jgi:hypothetical protein
MHTIWFRPHDSIYALSVEVSSAWASEVWERLAKEFHMISTKP